MSPEAQFSLAYLLIAFFALIFLQVYFTIPPEGGEQTRGRSRRRYGRRRAKARATEKRWKGKANPKWDYASG